VPRPGRGASVTGLLAVVLQNYSPEALTIMREEAAAVVSTTEGESH
jgi:hypothetical protein